MEWWTTNTWRFSIISLTLQKKHVIVESEWILRSSPEIFLIVRTVTSTHLMEAFLFNLFIPYHHFTTFLHRKRHYLFFLYRWSLPLPNIFHSFSSMVVARPHQPSPPTAASFRPPQPSLWQWSGSNGDGQWLKLNLFFLKIKLREGCFRYRKKNVIILKLKGKVSFPWSFIIMGALLSNCPLLK